MDAMLDALQFVEGGLNNVGLTMPRIGLILLGIALYPALLVIYSTLGSSNPRIVWKRMSRFPFGPWLFHRLVYSLSPNSSSTGLGISEYSDSRVVLYLWDTTSKRNLYQHISFGCLVAVAETAAILQVMAQLGKQRAVPRGLRVQYFGKAHGTLFASCQFKAPLNASARYEDVPVNFINHNGEQVACVFVTFAFEGPEKKGQ